MLLEHNTGEYQIICALHLYYLTTTESHPHLHFFLQNTRTYTLHTNKRTYINTHTYIYTHINIRMSYQHTFYHSHTETRPFITCVASPKVHTRIFTSLPSMTSSRIHVNTLTLTKFKIIKVPNKLLWDKCCL